MKDQGGDFDRVHLQWFGDVDAVDDADGDAGGDDNQDADLDARIRKAVLTVTKDLETTRRESAGKDKKITELRSEIEKLRQATLSKEQLADLKVREAEERMLAAEKLEQQADERIRRAEQKNLRFEVLSNIKGFPMEVAEMVHGESAEEIEIAAKKLMKLIVSERDKRENARKASDTPRSGDGRQPRMDKEKWDSMTQAERRDWAASASDEDIDMINSGGLDN